MYCKKIRSDLLVIAVLALPIGHGLVSTYAAELGHVSSADAIFITVPASSSVVLSANSQIEHHLKKDLDLSQPGYLSLEQTVSPDYKTTLPPPVISQESKANPETNNQLVPGSFDKGDFHIDIVSLPNGKLKITTTNIITGTSSAFEVDK